MKQPRIVGWALAAVPAIGLPATSGLAQEVTLGASAVISLDRVVDPSSAQAPVVQLGRYWVRSRIGPSAGTRGGLA